MPQDGDPSEIEVKENVLSQEAESAVETEPQAEAPKEKTPDEKRRDDSFAKTRIANREWKKSINELKSNPTALLEEAAREEGIDPEKEENKKNLRMHARFETKRNQNEFAIKNKAANEILSETFSNMGIKPDSSKGYMIGTALMKKYGVDNPDVYTEELVRKEMEAIAEEFAPRRDPINNSILRKAASSVPQKQNPNGRANPSEDKRLEAEAAEHGVSPERFKRMQELKKKLPKSYQKKV